MGGTILSSARVSSGTSPTLGSVHERGELRRSGVHSGLSNVVHSPGCGSDLRSTVVARQGNQFIIPMGTRRQDRISNVIRSASKDNTAMFVRPTTMVRTGGHVGILRDHRHSRVREVLSRLSRRTKDFTSAVGVDYRSTTRLGLVFSGTRLTCGVGTAVPVVGSHNIVRLGGTHRPLLSPGGTIPVSISLNSGCSSLIVANPGANNGAISVGAVNLLALVTRYNLFVPTGRGDDVTMFGGIFTSVNRRRDVRRSLSAFSTRVAAVMGVDGGISRDSLILVSRLKTKASPMRNTTLTITILRSLHHGNTGVTTAARCSRLGRCTLHAGEIRGTSYRFSISALGPACGLVANVPNHSGTFTVSRGLNLSGRIVRRTTGLVSRRGAEFRSIISALRGAHLRVRGRGRGATRVRGRVSRVGGGTRGRLSLTGRGNRARVLVTRGRTGHVLRGTGHTTTSLVVRLSHLGHRRSGRGGTSRVTHGTGTTLGRRLGAVSSVACRGGSFSNSSSSCILPEPLGANSGMFIGALNARTRIMSLSGGNGTRMGTNIVGVGIGTSRLHLLTPGGGPGGRDLCHSMGRGSLPDNGSDISLHNRSIRRTVTSLSVFVSKILHSNLGRLAVVRNGKANALEETVRRRLGSRPGVGSCEANMCNRNRRNIAVTRLG